jgi:phospholipase A1/A2
MSPSIKRLFCALSMAAAAAHTSAHAQQDTSNHEAAVPAVQSNLWHIWDLEQGEKGDTFRVLPDLPTYFLPVRYSDRSNTLPHSPALNHTAAQPLPIESTEAKFQLSFKTKVWEDIFHGNGNLWLAYTQQSNWQIYNDAASTPFRETNYEPEAIVAFRTNLDAFGLRWRLSNLGFVHQSNGQADPLSRSWNRLYTQFGLERGKFMLFVRPWWRLPESAATDDNPDIGSYLGNGDVRAVYGSGGHIYSMLGRYSFSGHRGAVQLDAVFPISGPLKGYLQIFSGYGETLIDYNHYQNVFGIGLLLMPWQ